jgi:AcrR family transcriptional regulator
MNKREQQRLERQEQILNCSLDMIITKGYEAMKIRDIAEKLHISTGLFFNYFESKEKIYEELVKIGIHGPKSIFDFDADGMDPIELLEKITEIIFESVRTCSITSKMFVLMARTVRSDSIPENVKRVISDFDILTPMVSVIIKGQQLGEMKEGDPVALAIAYEGAVQGIAEIAAAGPELPLPESSWIVDILRKNS